MIKEQTKLIRGMRMFDFLLRINQKILSQKDLFCTLDYILTEGVKLLRADAIELELNGPLRKSFLCEKENGTSKILRNWEKGNFISLLTVPLKIESRSLGTLFLHGKHKKSLTSLDKKIAGIIASQATLAIVSKSHVEKIKKVATIEKLTGLYNQSHFYICLEEEIRRSSRNRCSLSLLFMDVDRLKQVNDNWGHLVGDKVLQLVARSIKCSIRKIDIGFRYGGDEFVVILPGVSSSDTVPIAERIQKKLKKLPFPCPVSLSFGIASFPRDGKQPRELLDRADRAMYQAKREGGDRIRQVQLNMKAECSGGLIKK